MCDTYSLNCIHFPFWTLIDSFVWNEIVHGISSDVCGWHHQYDVYSTPIRWSRVMLCCFPGSVGLACSPILSVNFKGMGCEPVLDLSATPDEAVSIICTIVDKVLSTFLGKADVCELYYWLARCFSRASYRRSSYNLSLGSLTWLTYAYGMLSQDDIAPREFCLSNVYANTNL